MTDRDLYLATIADIEAKLAISDEYNLIRATGLLRQLFLDDRPLAHWANRDTRIKFRFVILVPREPFTGDEFIGYLNISPDSNQPMKSREFRLYSGWLPNIRHQLPVAKIVKIDEFLATTCLVFHGQSYSVKDVIKHCANVLGGIHLGTAADHSLHLMRADKSIGPIGRNVTELLTRSIVQVALAGISPLTKLLTGDVSENDDIGRESNPHYSPIAAGENQDDDSPRGDNAPSPEVADTGISLEGTLSFWCQHAHADWPTNGDQYCFGTQLAEGIATSVMKLPDRSILISITGPFGNNFVLHAPIPDCGANGLHIVITWKLDSLNLYLNAQEALRIQIPIQPQGTSE